MLIRNLEDGRPIELAQPPLDRQMAPSTLKFNLIDKMDNDEIELRAPENSKYVTGASGRRRTMHINQQKAEPLKRIQQNMSTRHGDRNSLSNFVMDQSCTRTSDFEQARNLNAVISPDKIYNTKSYQTSTGQSRQLVNGLKDLSYVKADESNKISSAVVKSAGKQILSGHNDLLHLPLLSSPDKKPLYA